MTGPFDKDWPGEASEPGSASLEEFDTFGDFVDGVSAVVQRVGVRVTEAGVDIVRPDGTTMFWPMDTLRALSDQAVNGGVVLTPGHGTMARLVLAEGPWISRLRMAASKLEAHAPVDNWPGIIRWAAGAVASVAAIIFVLVPIMASQLATYLPPEGERALGDATFGQIRNMLGNSNAPIQLCEEPAGLAALAAMEARLNAEDDLPYPVEIAVLDHKLVNAFALPGGRVTLFKGLLDMAETPDEVAAVLAHELGHVVYRDPTRDALRSAGSIGVLGLLFGDFAGGTVVLMLGNQLINAKYSQSAETRADDYAHQLMLDAGLDPGALGTMFERMRGEHGDAEGFMAHLASHPQMQARIEAAARAAENRGDTTPVLTDAQWSDFKSICGAEDDSDVEDEPGEEDPRPRRRLGGDN